MGSPKFSLQNVLDIRHGKVEILEIELGKLLAIHQETVNLMASLEEYQNSIIVQLNETQTGDIDLVKLNLLRLNALQITRHMDLVAIELKKQANTIEEKRAELIQAKQSEETLETLKRKRNEIYTAEQIYIEAQAQDDIYIARTFRNYQQGA